MYHLRQTVEECRGHHDIKISFERPYKNSLTGVIQIHQKSNRIPVKVPSYGDGQRNETLLFTREGHQTTRRVYSTHKRETLESAMWTYDGLVGRV